MRPNDIEALFAQAQEFVRSGGLSRVAASTAAEERELGLTLYGLYKQATEGKCNAPQPSYFDYVRRKKYQAWLDCGDMPREEAMKHYVGILDQRVPSWAGPARETRLRREGMGTADLPDNVHMGYFLTGATGFLGKHLLKVLLARNPSSVFYCLTTQSDAAFASLIASRFGEKDAARIFKISGDLRQENFGMGPTTMQKLKEAKVTCMFHLAALYDLKASPEENHAVNVEGTGHAVEVANQLGVEFNYVSSIAVAGDYQGTFLEDMYDEGQTHPNPYYHTKFLAEGVVRHSCNVPLRIFRPGIVVGSTETGEVDKIDGPYYLFDTIRTIRRYIPSWIPLIGLQGKEIPLVPVDYVVKAMDACAHRPGSESKIFHLVDPNPKTFLQVLNILCEAAHAPTFSSRVTDTVLGLLPSDFFGTSMVEKYPKALQWPFDLATGLTGVPEEALKYAFFATRFDDSATQAFLSVSPTPITCPPLETYAWRLWDYYERILLPALSGEAKLTREVRGKVCVVTGGGSGIGLAISKKLVRAGATVIIVGSNEERLANGKTELEKECKKGGRVMTYTCNLAVEEECKKLPKRILGDVGRVDVLVNNAGRSIRRSGIYATDRMHDFKRTMDLNYYGSVAMVLGFLNSMRANHYGRIINVSSIGAQTNQPRFSAYAASKAALDTFSKCLNSEVAHENVTFHTVYMPLVKTNMIAPTSKLEKGAGFNYYDMVAITPDQAADMVLSALTDGRKTVATTMGNIMQLVYHFSPETMDRVFNYIYRIEPETAPEGMPATTDKELYLQTLALGNLFAGLQV